MSSGISTKTPYAGFNIVSFDFPRWGIYEHENWRRLDAVLQASLVITGGIWHNATTYAAGDRAADELTFKIYACQVSHTSAATGTFADDRTANPTYWQEVINAPIYRGLWTTFTVYNYLDVVSLPDGSMYIANNAHTSTGTFNPAFWTQTAPALPGTFPSTWATVSGKPDFAQGKLKLVGGNLSYLPNEGNRVTINGVEKVIPGAGVLLAASGLVVPQTTTNRSITTSVATLTFSANSIPNGAKVGVKGLAGTNQVGYNGTRTLTGATGTTISFPTSVATDASAADVTGTVYVIYCIYLAVDGSGNLTLEPSTTWYTVDTTTGIATKTGDLTRRLVGMAVPVAGPAWVNTDGQRFVRSYHNRSTVATYSKLTANRTSASTTPAEINVELRQEALMWSDEVWRLMISGRTSHSAASGVNTIFVSTDAFSNEEGASLFSFDSAGFSRNIAAQAHVTESEGYHVASGHIQTTGGTSTIYGVAGSVITALVGEIG